MNLVAKEFVAARDDEQGVLILSRFTGAARELRDAVMVNPYDIEQHSRGNSLCALEMGARRSAPPVCNDYARWSGSKTFIVGRET